MSDKVLDVLEEASRWEGSVALLHPLKLDRWHRALVGLPDAIYMQLGCGRALEHVQTAVGAIKAFLDVMNADQLPIGTQEIARRQIRAFTWYVQREHPLLFKLMWDKASSSWQLDCSQAPGTVKTVPSIETGVEQADKWADEISQNSDE